MADLRRNMFSWLLTSLAFLILLSCKTTTKEQQDLVSDLVPQEIPGWRLQQPIARYDRETIFDYIDGAGEVYRMYGFREAAVAHYVKAEAPRITVEVFDMGSAEDAYGVFTHAREHEESGIGQAYEYRGSLLCFWQSQYFVCVLADEETPSMREAIFALGRAVDREIKPAGAKPRVVTALPVRGLNPNSIRYFHLHTSLNYHYFLATENILNLSPETRAALARYDDSTYLLCIEYPSARQAEQGYNGLVKDYVPEARDSGVAQLESGKWVAVRQDDDFVVVALDALSEDHALELIEEVFLR